MGRWPGSPPVHILRRLRPVSISWWWRCSVTAVSSRSYSHPVDPQVVGHPEGRQGGILQEAGLVCEFEGPGEMHHRAAGVQAADHLEPRLLAVEPGQERDACLVVERRGTEDVPAEFPGGVQDGPPLGRVAG